MDILRTKIRVICFIAVVFAQVASGNVSVVINEIHHNPATQVELIEFVELYNPSTNAVDISAWYFSDGITYEFPPGTILPAGGYIVVAEDPSLAYTPVTLMDKYGVPANRVYGPFVGGLSNDGEKIELSNSLGEEVDQVEYQLGFPWPTVGDGNSIQLVNAQEDNDLGGSWRSAYPTPGADNTSVYTTNLPPQIRQVEHHPKQPASSDVVTITAKVTDPDGVAAVTLSYQVVDPGSYIPINFLNLSENPAYENPANWTSLAMYDDGNSGDEFAGDHTYSVQMPAGLQTHRRLIRYRITVEDTTSQSITVPYDDDPQPNFAYFVYDGVPAWSGADEPGVTPVVTYDVDVMNSLPVYHLIAVESDVLACQYNSAYIDKVYRFAGTLVYDGEVYDHIHFRVKGQSNPYYSGKNRWKFRFNRGHYFQGRDDYGRKNPYKWELMNVSSGINVWSSRYMRGFSGIDEAAAFRFFAMVGAPACTTSWFQYRIIDSAVETHSTDQYSGDFWGLYMTIENPGGDFLKRNNLADGNVYKMNSTSNPSKTAQGATEVTDASDYSWFFGGTGYNKTNPIQEQEWWEQHVNLHSYYGYKSVFLSINHQDHRDNHNHIKYHEPGISPQTGQWWMLPWDLDNTFKQTSTGSENFSLALGHEPIEIAAKNRGREIRDLLFNEEQSGQLLDELAAVLKPDPQELSLVEANRAMWDHHPRIEHPGLFFTFPDFPTKDFSGAVSYINDFLTSLPWGGGAFSAYIEDTAIPDTPTITYTGSHTNYPGNDLLFETSAFSDPQGAGTFSALKWRIAEVEPFSVTTIPPDSGGAISLIAADSEWTYFKGTQEPSNPTNAWRELSFNDNSWSVGNAPIGYGATVNTALTDMRGVYTSVYLRKEFQVTDPAEIETLILSLNYDEGFNVWINGTHLDSINVSGAELPYTALASSYISGQTSTTLSYSNPNFLNSGTNIITIQLLNKTLGSSDFLFDPVLTANLTGTPGSGGSYEFVNSGKPGTYEIDAIWESAEITTFTNAVRIPADGIKEGNTYRVRCRMKDDTGRWSHWSSPHQFTAGKPINAKIRSDLRVTEVMYNNGNADFIELKNTGTTTLNLSAVSITSGVDFHFPAGWTLPAGEFVLVVKDQTAFEAQYGTGWNAKIAGTFLDSSLSNGGETIKIKDFWNGTIISFEYNDARGWPIAADGAGHSLVPLDLAIEEQPLGTLDYGANWRQSSYIGGSPGEEDPDPPAAGVLINECMAHTDYTVPPHESNDWLELYNAGTSTIQLDGNWYLSDDINNLKKYPFPASALLSGGTISYDQVNHFNPDGTGPLGWGLNKAGDTLFLSYLPGFSTDRVVDCIKFKGQENGISLSRYPDGGTYWFQTSPPTRDGANNNPVPRVVISEIMYHPQADTLTETYDEYVEIYNPTAAAIDLWTSTSPWALDGGVSYIFPAGTTLSASNRILVVDFDPTDATRLAAFEAAYGTGSLTVGTDIFGPWSGDLSNNGERLTLQKSQDSDDPLNPQDISWIIVDECIYNDYWPWPAEVDGTGSALHRAFSTANRSGNDPSNWYAGLPAPGNMGIAPLDLDGDGMPSMWEDIYSLDSGNAADAWRDSDSDGLINLHEYLSGTNPRDPASFLGFEWIGLSNSVVTLEFMAVMDKPYLIEHRLDLTNETWQVLTNINPVGSTGPMFIMDPLDSTNSTRFYRLVIPGTP